MFNSLFKCKVFSAVLVLHCNHHRLLVNQTVEPQSLYATLLVSGVLWKGFFFLSFHLFHHKNMRPAQME